MFCQSIAAENKLQALQTTGKIPKTSPLAQAANVQGVHFLRE